MASFQMYNVSKFGFVDCDSCNAISLETVRHIEGINLFHSQSSKSQCNRHMFTTHIRLLCQRNVATTLQSHTYSYVTHTHIS
jgi:hypothetical protein